MADGRTIVIDTKTIHIVVAVLSIITSMGGLIWLTAGLRAEEVVVKRDMQAAEIRAHNGVPVDVREYVAQTAVSKTELLGFKADVLREFDEVKALIKEHKARK